MSVELEQQTYTRPVSPTELWFLTYPASIPGVIQVVVEGAGEIDPDELRSALAVAGEACPGSRLTRKAMLWVDSGSPPPVRVVDGSDIPTPPPSSASIPCSGFDREHLTGLPDLHGPLMGDRGGPTCEVLLVPGEPTTLVFRAFHAVMDGRGALLWIDDVFRALRGEDPVGAPSTLTEGELVDSLEPPATAGIEADLEWPSALGARGAAAEAGFFWRRRTVDGHHPGLVAQLALAVTTACGLRTARFRVPVDLRRYDPDLRSTGNLTHNPLIDVEADEPWESAHERLLTLLAARQDVGARADPAIGSMPLPALRQQLMGLDRFSAERGRYASVATLSHVGRIDLDALSAGSFVAGTVYALPNSGPAGPPEINAVECAGRTEITIGWFDGPGAAERAEALLDRIEDALSPPDRRFWAGNRTTRPLRHAGTVVDQFAEQVAATPDAVALTGPDREITFAELDRLADSVAADLRDRGIGRGALVGLLAGRSVAAVAGIWGVLRAGAAYLPLDPQHPDGRLTDLVAEAGLAACLAERAHADRAVGRPTVVLEAVQAVRRDPVPSVAGPADLAYVIYTSGSTGRPKGVGIEHRQLTVFASWAVRTYGFDAATRIPLFTSLAFDLSNTALFLPALVGGTTVLVPDEPNHVVLRDMLTRWGVTALKLTPTHLDLIVALGLAAPGVDVVIAGGELLRGSVAAAAQEGFGPGCRIVNEYGPTETTIGCMSRVFEPADAGRPSVPIGVPTDNTRIHLLDASRRFVAAGEVGEMYLGGDQLARGYRGRPDLDRERFVRLADGTRAYRSGDLARLLPAGELESVGRNDEQLKVLGHRIEPAEVARVLEEHPAVHRAFATGLVRPGGTAKQLCAWVVPTDPAAPFDVAALTGHTGERLPRYMVPTSVRAVADLPRTGNGKVDVTALSSPFDGAGPVVTGGGDVDPDVARIWGRVLDVDAERLTGDADFHHLGGDSATLLAMLAAVCTEVVGADGERAFMARLPEIVRNPTLAVVGELARR